MAFTWKARLLSLAAIAASALASNSHAEDIVTVDNENFVFAPTDVHVRSGTRIVFRNKDHLPHSVVGEADGKELFRSPEQVGEDETYTVVLSKAGDVPYYCGLHPGMKGKISVSQ